MSILHTPPAFSQPVSPVHCSRPTFALHFPHEPTKSCFILLSIITFRVFKQLEWCWRDGGRMCAIFLFGEGVLWTDAMSSPSVFGPMLGRWAAERCLYRGRAAHLSFCVDYSGRRQREFVWVCKWAEPVSPLKPVMCDSMIEKIIGPSRQAIARRQIPISHSRFFPSPLLSSPN